MVNQTTIAHQNSTKRLCVYRSIRHGMVRICHSKYSGRPYQRLKSTNVTIRWNLYLVYLTSPNSVGRFSRKRNLQSWPHLIACTGSLLHRRSLIFAQIIEISISFLIRSVVPNPSQTSPKQGSPMGGRIKYLKLYVLPYPQHSDAFMD